MAWVASLNQPEVIADIAAFKPDLIVSIRFGHIFKPPVIALARLGVINLHSGLLPEYRGILATFWSLLHGRNEYGYTLHTIDDSGIDTGAIIARRSFPVDAQLSLFEHIAALYAPGAESILEAIAQYRQGLTPGIVPQSEAGSDYYTLPSPEDFERLVAQGWQLLHQPAYYAFLKQYEAGSQGVGIRSVSTDFADTLQTVE